MIEKNKAENELKKERFEFVLTINDNVICQRYFHINGFKENSFHSVEFLNTFRNCVKLIKDDIKAKSRLYSWHTSPQVFDTEEQMRSLYMEKRLENHSFVLCRDTENVYTFNEGELTPYDGYFNKQDYLKIEGENNVNKYNGYNDDKFDTKYTIKFALYDNGKEVISEIWDGNIYPKFIRMNIDLSNSKNRYITPDSNLDYEAILINILNNGRNDIIPVIVRDICVTCSNPGNLQFNYKVNGYGTNLKNLEQKYVSVWERALQAKTKKYFSNLGA